MHTAIARRILPSILILLAGRSAFAQQPANPIHLQPHHITAAVKDVDRAAAWYQRMLGFEIRERGKHGAMSYVELAIPGFGVALVQDPLITAKTDDQPHVARWVHIVFSVLDPDAAYHSLRSKGAILHTRDAVASDPIHSFSVEDSEGNEIEIVGDRPS
jgi:catechol 2,3-dioxygenase-like lactoylglutathione lyase family enzyme